MTDNGSTIYDTTVEYDERENAVRVTIDGTPSRTWTASVEAYESSPLHDRQGGAPTYLAIAAASSVATRLCILDVLAEKRSSAERRYSVAFRSNRGRRDYVVRAASEVAAVNAGLHRLRTDLTVAVADNWELRGVVPL